MKMISEVPSQELVQSPHSDLNFTDSERRVFSVVKGKIYIGGEEIKPDLLDVLKQQARTFKISEFYEVFSASVLNEAYDLALKQSTNWDHVQFAKALKHWHYFLDNMFETLTK